MARMRLLAVVLVASVVTTTGCASGTYKIPGKELERLAEQPPDTRAQHVRVVQQLDDEDLGPAQPVTTETTIVFFPQINIYGAERRRYVSSGGGGGGGSWRGSSHSGGGGLKLGGGGGDGKGAAIAILVVAAVALVVVAGVEGSRYDGYAALHPMHPVYLVGRDGDRVVMPLAWIDPQTAAWAKYGYIRRSEGPWNETGRAPLDRQGWNYNLYGGLGTFKSADGSKALGTATTIQLGYFPIQELGILGSLFLGWRDNAVEQTLFETRYTLELQGYPVHAGPVHFGLYGGGGGASRLERGLVGGNASSLALLGGAMLQLDVNTRIAITARFGQTYAHSERMTDAMLGLSVY